MFFPYHIKDFNFVKATSLGDDFILFDQRIYNVPEEVLPIMARTICRRDFSIGADGLILICEPTDSKYDIRCRIFNPDGSEADMRSSALRIFSKYVYQQHLVTKLKLNVETKRGLVVPELMKIISGTITGVRVNMGSPSLNPKEVPVNADEPVLDAPLRVEDREFRYSAISMGTPHCVIFTNDLSIKTVKKYGALIEGNTSLFPQRTNVEFVRVLSQREADFRVYRRNLGITNVCGKGACAAGVAGVMLGLFQKNYPIIFHMMEGELSITYTGEHVLIEGPATEVYTGHIENLVIE